MAITSVSTWKCNDRNAILDVVRKAAALAARHGVAYSCSRIHTGANAGAWLVMQRFADWEAYGKGQAALAADAEYQAALAQGEGIAERIERNIVVDIDV